MFKSLLIQGKQNSTGFVKSGEHQNIMESYFFIKRHICISFYKEYSISSKEKFGDQLIFTQSLV